MCVYCRSGRVFYDHICCIWSESIFDHTCVCVCVIQEWARVWFFYISNLGASSQIYIYYLRERAKLIYIKKKTFFSISEILSERIFSPAPPLTRQPYAMRSVASALCYAFFSPARQPYAMREPYAMRSSHLQVSAGECRWEERIACRWVRGAGECRWEERIAL